MLNALFAQHFLRTFDRHAVVMKQGFDTREQVNVFWTVVASPTSTFHRLDLRELTFPKPQHMRGSVEGVGDLADGAKRVARFGH